MPEEGEDVLRSELERLTERHGAAALERVLLTSLLRGKKGFVPDCDHEYSYTYEYIVGVDACPVPEDTERDLEEEAKKLAEDQAKKYCKRTDNCKTLHIVESSPTGGGCTCVNLPVIGKKCFYICRWTVKYKCVKSELY
jgi:hypothetical protein